MRIIQIRIGEAVRNYDLMLNSGDLGLDKCVELLCEAVK